VNVDMHADTVGCW